ncbi:hypothetical protein V1264_012427 [Littorina saxatilis]|uniref:Uncharacterized protein n=1 Tax=Littorina saxatilis TaxID=31220 RepID=A0AAN9BX23_9CAEN
MRGGSSGGLAEKREEERETRRGGGEQEKKWGDKEEETVGGEWRHARQKGTAIVIPSPPPRHCSAVRLFSGTAIFSDRLTEPSSPASRRRHNEAKVKRFLSRQGIAESREMMT